MSNIEAFPSTAQQPAPSKPKGWHGVDLDGTLAIHDPAAFAIDKIGAPVEPMVRRVKAMIAAGWTVKIMTARAADLSAHAVIHAWLLENGLPVLEVTDRKDFDMVRLWDDRAVAVMSNVGLTHLDELSLQRQDLDLLAIGLGVPPVKGRNFHETYLAIAGALTELESVADAAMDNLSHISGDKFKGGDGSQAFKYLCAARAPLRRFMRSLERFRKVTKTEEEAGDEQK
jgi:hypothetical protein